MSYIIYGAGYWGKKAYSEYKGQVLFFVDKVLAGDTIDNIPIYAPQKLVEYTDIPVIIAVAASEGIKEYLISLGVKTIKQ